MDRVVHVGRPTWGIRFIDNIARARGSETEPPRWSTNIGRPAPGMASGLHPSGLGRIHPIQLSNKGDDCENDGTDD